MEDKKVFLDTNILIYAKLEKSNFHNAVIDKLNELLSNGYEFWISRQVIREYLVWITREDSLKSILTKTLIQNDFLEFQENFKIADENNLVSEMLLSLFDQELIIGKQIHDANIVATMKVFGINYLYTYNTDDFKRFLKLIKLIEIK